MKLLAMALVLVTTSVLADSVTVLETRVGRSFDHTQADAKFFMDTQTGIGYADITVTEYVRDTFPRRPICDRWGCYPAPAPAPFPRTILSERVMVPGLTLENNQMIYRNDTAEINCGRLGYSRVLRRPTLYLTGNCELNTFLSFDELKVTFDTK